MDPTQDPPMPEPSRIRQGPREEKVMRSPKTIRWDVPISKTDFERFMKGFSPSCMEERWKIKPEHLSTENAYRVRFARSWTSNPYHELFISKKGPAIESMTYESVSEAGQEITENYAKDLVIKLARSWLDCEIEAIPKEDKN